MKPKFRKETTKKIKENIIKQENKILTSIINLIALGSSVTDILTNSLELIVKEFKCSIFVVYILEDNLLKCLIKKVSDRKITIPQEIVLDINEKQEILKIKKPLSNKNEELFTLLKKLQLSSNIFYIVSPIINVGELVGVMIAGTENKAYNEQQANLVFAVSSLLAPSFSNTRQAFEKEKIKKQIETLINITQMMATEKNVDEILKIIVHLIAEVMEYKICSVMLYDEEKQELIIKATQSLSNEYRNKPNLKIGQSLSGRAVKEKRPISAIDVTKEPSYKYPEIARREGLKSMLAVPMIYKTKTTGVINVYTVTEHIFTEDEIKMLTSVANLAAVAIGNAKLEEETIKVKDALETRKIIERAKGILMKFNNMTEEEAYTTMRKKAMDLCKPLKEIAEAIILTMEINKKKSGGKDVSGK